MDTPSPSTAQPQAAHQDNSNVDDVSVEPPIWASSSSERPAADLAPPPTYDPSAYSAPLDAVPAFKPRKSNRVSGLSYPADGAQLPVQSPGTPPGGALPAPRPTGGPPSLFGPSGAGAPATPPPPPGASSGIKLPPPPPTKAETESAPVPYTKGDFRTAGIVNHWNDPPMQIFKKPQNEENTPLDFSVAKEKLATVIAECSANVPPAQRRMFEDTTKRLQVLQEQLEHGTIKERIVKPLEDMIEALSTRSFTQCQAIHAKLMQTEFESEGKWLLGFKRLMDLYASLPPPS